MRDEQRSARNCVSCVKMKNALPFSVPSSSPWNYTTPPPLIARHCSNVLRIVMLKHTSDAFSFSFLLHSALQRPSQISSSLSHLGANGREGNVSIGTIAARGRGILRLRSRDCPQNTKTTFSVRVNSLWDCHFPCTTRKWLNREQGIRRMQAHSTRKRP